eukprot:NODE_398_length_8105_cov_1.375094.p6 type:complete len:198 gc:universal NODE_398_length_8105_cov_1.375094:4743-4150(-)
MGRQRSSSTVSVTSVKSTNSFSLETPEFLFSVTSLQKYSTTNPQELSLELNELLHVSEERDLFYFCYSPASKKSGFVPKNYVQIQKPLPVLPATIKADYEAESDELGCEEGERIILLAQIDLKWVYAKKMTRELIIGRIRIDLLHADGDIKSLPLMDEYNRRTNVDMVNSEASDAHVPQKRNRTSFKAFQQMLSPSK